MSDNRRNPVLDNHNLISESKLMEERGRCPRILSSHKKIHFPLPEILYTCYWIKLILFLHKFQIAVHVGSFSGFIVLKDPPLRYFIEKSLLSGWFLSAKIRETSLPPNARLANSGSLICNPPSIIGLLIVSHLTKWILFWFPFPPLQRKSLRILAIWTEMDFGARSNED